ncbi:hypothetical protein [Ferruginibacter sp.]
MFQKYIVILCALICSLSHASSQAQVRKPTAVVDTSNFSITIDSTIVYLYKNVKDRPFWLDVLSRDTMLLSAVKRKFGVPDPMISIVSIRQVINNKLEYEFQLYYEPKKKKKLVEIQTDSLPISAIPQRPVHYIVKLSGIERTLSIQIAAVEFGWFEL